MSELQTRTLTLVVQAVVPNPDASFWDLAAAALTEYAVDAAGGNAMNSQYELHVAKNGVRIEAITSVPPARGAAAVEHIITADGNESLIARLRRMRSAAEYAPGGTNDDAIGRYAYPDAMNDLRSLIAEQLRALGVSDEVGT